MIKPPVSRLGFQLLFMMLGIGPQGRPPTRHAKTLAVVNTDDFIVWPHWTTLSDRNPGSVNFCEGYCQNAEMSS